MAQTVPGIGEDVTALMGGGGSVPPVGADVTHLMDAQSDFKTTNEKDAGGNAVVSGVKDFFGELQSLNPVAINRSVQQAFWHPIDTVKGVLSAQDQLRVQ